MPGNSIRRAAVTLAVLLVAGCASSEQPRDAHWRGGAGHAERRGDGEGPARAMLFISPCGQPFRARWGEPYPVAAWFAQADKNGDGRLDRTEFRADCEAFFHVLDRDHDGIIDGSEVSFYEQQIAPEILGGRGGAGPSAALSPGLVRVDYQMGGGWGGGGQRGGGHRRGQGDSGGQRRSESPGAGVVQGAAAYSLFNEPEPVTVADLELNGRITLAEFLQNADRHFDLLDKDHEGYLTLAKLPLTPVQQRLQAREHRPAPG